MAEEDDAQKTEDPTQRKLAQSRKKGQVSQSQEVKSWAILLGGAMGIMLMTPQLMKDITAMSTRFIESGNEIFMDQKQLRFLFYDILTDLGMAMAPMLGLLMVIAIFSSVAQTGLIFAPEKIKPDFSKISLSKGLKQKFSMRALVEFLKGILKLVVVSLVSFSVTIPFLDDLALFPFFEIPYTLDRINELVIVIVMASVMVMTVIAVIDFSYQKYSFTKQMRMSRQDVKDEHKDTEGDPQIKARIRRVRMERYQRRMMAAVPEADVVVTNPTHFAVALEYKMDSMAAPRLIAKGADLVAHKIKEIAKDNDVPIVENPPLARALFASVELDEEIPIEHYKAVAEVIGYVMRLRGNVPGGTRPEMPS